MSTWHIRPGTVGGADDGTSKADAWLSVNNITGTANGDIYLIYPNAIDTLTTSFTLPNNATTFANMYVVDESGVADPTAWYVIDCNSAADRGLQFTGTTNFWSLSGIHVKNAVLDGAESSSGSCNNIRMNRMKFTDCGGKGLASARMNKSTFKNILTDGCVGGQDSRDGNIHIECVDIDTSGSSYTGDQYSVWDTCLSINPSVSAFTGMQDSSYIRNTICDGGAHVLSFDSGVENTTLNGVLAINGSYGIFNAGNINLYNCYIPANGEDEANSTAPTTGGGQFLTFSEAGLESNDLAGTDANAGLTNRAALDYSRVSASTIWNQLTTLLGSATPTYQSAGFNPNASGGSSSSSSGGVLIDDGSLIR